MTVSTLPAGRAPTPVTLPHFPDALHAVVWRNWNVIPVDDLARVLGGTSEQITAVGTSMGLPALRLIEPSELRRNYMTVLHRNWHLLPYEQLCDLLGWDAGQMQFALSEDDFMFIKLGGYKPKCPPVRYGDPDEIARKGAAQIARIMAEELDGALAAPSEPPFGFIQRFREGGNVRPNQTSQLRMVYPYFLRFGDPLIGDGVNDIPEGYLAELAASGINAIWLQGVLNKLAPWELAPELSAGWEERLANLNRLVERCRRFGIEVLLYLNEPRAMPRSFFEKFPELRGVEETPERVPYSPDVVALCTSAKPVQDFLVNSVHHVFERVSGLGGALVITFSENLTNCYSREYDSDAVDEFALRSTLGETKAVPPIPCPRCAPRGPEAVNAEVCQLIDRGMRQAGSKGKFLLYAWSTPEKWLPAIVENLPVTAWLLCVSEWGKSFTRGDYTGKVNEYSISIVGPGEKSLAHWELARRGGRKTAAKMQAANTFELSSLPYIPALRLVAQHLANISEAGVDGMMLGWTAGGSPSPNLELVTEFARTPRPTVHEAMLGVAERRFGLEAAETVVRAWDIFSVAYTEFPFDMAVCYYGPQSLGPANLLFAEPSGFAATMVTFPFDDLDGWRGPYSVQTFERQFEKLARRWEDGVALLAELLLTHPSEALEDECRIVEAAHLHFRSTVNQIRFIQLRQTDPAGAAAILRDEIALARRLFDLVSRDSRIGFEATNQYAYIGLDLAEKIISCRQILQQWEDMPHGQE